MLMRVLYRNPARQTLQRGAYLFTVAIRDDPNDNFGELCAILIEPVENSNEIWMQGWLAAEKRDSTPAPIQLHRLLHEPFHLDYRQDLTGRGLPARSVAVVAFQVARCENLDLDATD